MVLSPEVAVRQSQGTTAYSELRHMIVSGQFVADQRLVEADLVAQIGFSRMNIREALGRLQVEGLLTKEAGKSSVVRRVPLEELEEIIETRIALETYAVRVAAEKITDAQIEELLECMSRLEQARYSIPDFVDRQAELHHTWLSTSGLSYAPQFVEGLSALSAQTRMRTAVLQGRIDSSLAEHRAIVDALTKRRPEDCEVAVRNHLLAVKAAIHESVTQ